MHTAKDIAILDVCMCMQVGTRTYHMGSTNSKVALRDLKQLCSRLP